MTKQRNDVSRAASVNDLKRILLSSHYTQAEVGNNFEIINMNFLRVSNMIIGLIDHTTKKDDRAFATILRENKIVKWISPKRMRVCKVHEKLFNNEQACQTGSYYAGGA